LIKKIVVKLYIDDMDR